MRLLNLAFVAVLACALGFAWPAAGVYAQTATPVPAPAATPTPEINPAAIVAGLGEWSFWVMLLVTAIFGALGGLVYELLILQGNIELPHKPMPSEITEKFPYAIVGNLRDWGIFARLLIGAAAAIAALLVLSPQTAVALIATALVAGSVGTSIFRSLQDRILAALAVQEVAETRAMSMQAQAKVVEAEAALEGARAATRLRAALPEGGQERTRGPVPTTAADDPVEQSLDRAMRLLNEASGLHQGINR